MNESPYVESFIKNDHLGFSVVYNFEGVVNRYFPDFILKLKNGEHLIIETKGQDRDRDKTKRAFLDEWLQSGESAGRVWEMELGRLF